MSRRSKDTPGAKPLIWMAVIAAAMFGGLFYYVKFGPTSKLTPLERTSTPAETEVIVPVPGKGGQDDNFTTKSIKLPKGSDPIVASVNAYLDGLKFVQPEARLLEVKYDKGNAELRFSSNFRQFYGTDDEATIIKGIVRAVAANNSNIKTVTFTENGKPIDTLGQADLTGPQPVKDWISG